MTPLGQLITARPGVWLVGTNGVAHYFPGIFVPKAGHSSACHRWTSTTLDRDEGPMDHVCGECKEAVGPR